MLLCILFAVQANFWMRTSPRIELSKVQTAGALQPGSILWIALLEVTAEFVGAALVAPAMPI
jgi:hypothetical protein